MTPTLIGRIQTRIFLVAVVGGVWTLIVTPFLPRFDGAELSDAYRATFSAIVLVGVAGIVWEFVYHGLQQYRWEKDWPSLFGLLTGINEGLVVLFLLNAGIAGDRVKQVHVTAFLIHFATTWILIWLAGQGPMRVVFLRWRYRGGRIV